MVVTTYQIPQLWRQKRVKHLARLNFVMAFHHTSPFKLLAEDLKSCERKEKRWCLALKDKFRSTLVEFDLVWLQGRICSTSVNDGFTLNDGTGEVVIKTSTHTQGDMSWVAEGGTCLVLGTLLCINPPTVGAMKFGYLQDPLLTCSWDVEVKEAKCVLAQPPPQS